MNQAQQTWEAFCDVHVDYHSIFHQIKGEEITFFRNLKPDAALEEIKFTLKHIQDDEYLKERIFL